MTLSLGLAQARLGRRRSATMVVLSKKGTIRDGLAESGGDHDIGSLCGPAICGAECRADGDGFWGGLSVFYRVQDDAVPTVRRGCVKCDGRPVRDAYTVQRPMRWLTGTDVMRAPDSVRPAPCRSRRPSAHWFPRVGPPFCEPSAEHVRWVRRSFQIFGPR